MQGAQHARWKQVYVVLFAGCATYGLLQSLILPVLPTVQRELHSDQSTVTWVLTAYLLAAAVFTPILGRVGDSVGKKRMMMVSIGGLAVGSLLAAVATSMTLMIIGRVVQGLGGGLLPLSFGLIRDEFPPGRVAGAIGSLSALVGVGGGVGLALSGPIEEALGYTWLFWIPAIVASLTLAAAFFLVPESAVRQPARIGVRAPVLLSGWLVALLLGVSKAPAWGWGSTEVLGLIALAVVLAVLWVRVELGSEAPLIDIHMMRIPVVWRCNLVVLLLGVGLFAGIGFVPQLIQTPPSQGYGFGASVTESGLLMLPQAVALFVLGSLSGRIARRIGAKRALVAGASASGLAFVLFAAAHDHEWQIALASAMMGGGFGLCFAVIPGVIVGAVPATQTGVATGMNANIRTIGGAIGTAVMGTIVTSTAAADGIPTEAGYTWGFAVVALASGVAVIACLLVPARAGVAGDGDAVPAAAPREPALRPSSAT